MKDTTKEIYQNLVNLIKQKGTYRDKRHGNYVDIVPFEGYRLQLDTWNSSITVYKNGQRQESLGIDFGGFRCHLGMVNFWTAHVRLIN
jgi:hypothetical protein